MAIVEPVRNVWSLLAKAAESAGSLVDVVDTKGVTGLVRTIMGVDPAGIKKQVDDVLGTGLINLLLAGDKDSIEVVLKFRQNAMSRIDEFSRLLGIAQKYSSEDMPTMLEGIAEMRQYIADQDQPVSRMRHTRDQDELHRLRAALNQIADTANKAALSDLP